MVDVVGKLTAMAAANPQKLNWQVSIVDLLKLLGLESSLDARKQMASELGCPTDKMADSAHMNMWLHKTVLAKLAANGGNIPAIYCRKSYKIRLITKAQHAFHVSCPVMSLHFL